MSSRPYRLFFPLGLLLAWAGVLHWLLHATGLLPDYRPVFHSIAQIQGFLLCFALGFLFTAIPRRTGTAPPAIWQMLVAAAGAVGVVIAAWCQKLMLSQLFWLAAVAVLVSFAVSRFRSGNAGRRPPVSFVWIPLSILMGVSGSALIGLYGALGDEHYKLHELGRGLLLQGMFAGLVVGIGGMLLPLLTRGESSIDATGSSRHRLERLAHLAAAVLLAASFVIEVYASLRGGLVLRALLLLVLLLVTGRIWRPPCVPGWQRWAIWLGAWAIPVGYAMAAAFPEHKKAGLHVVFIGGYALMALAVGLHVSLSHGGEQKLARSFVPAVLAFVLAMLAAVVLRVLVDFDQDRFFFWIGCSAAAFLVATLFWAGMALPAIRNRS